MNILKKREYLGHTVNFKTRKYFKDRKSHYVDESQWTIFENTHEAIIDQATFDNVQRVRGNVRRYPDGWGEAHPLTGLMYCADCGGKMYVHRTSNGKRIPQYTCSRYSKVPVGTLCPTQHRINADVVMTLIADTLRAISAYSKNDRAEFVKTVKDAQISQQSSGIAQKKKRLAEAKRRPEELEKLLCQIYEDKVLGKLPEARFATLDARYADEQDELSGEIEELEQAVAVYEHKQQSAEKFIALIDKYENFNTLTTTMLNELVEKIVVHERDRKGCQDTTQEALRQKEERKDRLHQNYMRRKESGKQKQYEDKVKAVKKSEIEANKAAIRAEDIAKGVFAPARVLPKTEPQKASLPIRPAV